MTSRDAATNPPSEDPVQATAQATVAHREDDLVAVIGLGCVFPDANDVSMFWENVKTGRNSIGEIPKERWDPALYYDTDRKAQDKTYAKIGAFVTDFKFNALEYRIPPKVGQSLDGVQQMAIAATAEALRDSGYDRKEFDRSRCGIILGQAMGGETMRPTSARVYYPRFEQTLKETTAFQALPKEQQAEILSQFRTDYGKDFPQITEDTMPGELANVVAGRIANVFNLSGPNFTTDAACASSLAAIDAAVKGLLSRDFDMVITGGADRSMDIPTYVKFSKIGALSAAGSFPFDAKADGFVMGEGAGVLILKRLADALRDGDKVYGLVRGVGSSSDGKGKGITAPNIEGQLKCLRRAFDHAMVDPSSVQLIECHGTSTRVGDVVEVEALSQIWSDAPNQSVAIGSVKSQIGHLKSAAGAAGLIKSLLALKEHILPPSINFETPNPKIDWANCPFYVNTSTKQWPDPPGSEPRRAAVSSFGFGGTNFHVILEEYVPGMQPKSTTQEPKAAPSRTPVSDILLKRAKATPTAVPEEPPVPAATTDVLVLGADTADGLLAKIADTRRLIDGGAVTPRNFPHFCFTRNTQNQGQPFRLAVVATGPDDLVAKLDQAPDAIRDPRKRMPFAMRGIYVGEGPRKGRLAMLFPGQGSQYVDMLRDMGTRYARIRTTLTEADDVMTPFIGKPITNYIFLDEANGVDRDAAEESLKRTEICQPAVLAADLALFRLLQDHGVTPDVVAGHSLGEYGACVAAGVFSLKDALVAVSARGREMANVHVPDLGKMASVSADPEAVAKHLESIDGYVIPANKNCKVQTVIAGASDAVDRAVESFKRAGVQAQYINVSAAFHSEIVAPAQAPFRKVLEKIDIKAPTTPILSNVHADYYPTTGEARSQIVELLTRQIASPVEWQRQVERMHAEGAVVFAEVGPKKTLTAFCGNILEGKPFFAAATNHPKKGGFYHFNDTLALLSAWGYPIAFQDPTAEGVSTPGFRSSLERFVEPRAAAPAPSAAVPAGNGGAGSHDGLARRLDALGVNLDPILITGAAAGTPGQGKHVFADDNLQRIFEGRNHIDRVDDDVQRGMLRKNIVRLVKSATGDHRFEAIQDLNEVIRLMGQRGDFDLGRDYGIDKEVLDALDISSALAIAAGIEALKDAGIPLVRSVVKTTTGRFLPGAWVLPVPLQEETGIIFASAWPGYNRLIESVSRQFADRTGSATVDELAEIYADLIKTVRDPDVRARLTEWFTRNVTRPGQTPDKGDLVQFNRRFLLQVLAMGHSQLAQLIKAKGPNTQVNSACSSTTVALAIAEDWIRMGRCKRVLVVGGDDVSNPDVAEWFGAGFLAAGAATTKDKVEEAALPFDRRRHGMIMGMGAVGLVVEAESEVHARGQEGIVEIVASMIGNSGYHATRLDTEHVAGVMDALMAKVERRLGRPRNELAKRLLFMSHETYTPARGGSAAAEIIALRKAFGEDADKVVVSNTKGFTGHPMGASIEDTIAIKALQTGRVPPIANLREPDPGLGNLNLSKGGRYDDLEYAIRLSAGFGSQIGMTFLRLLSKDAKRIVDPAKYKAWLRAMSGQKEPDLEVVNRTLRVRSALTASMQLTPTAVAGPAPQPAPAEPAPGPTPVPSPGAPPTPEPMAAMDRDMVLARLMDLFADKTGYPKDMLEPDLDLEADLGIDTVKQAEIFGELRESYGLPRDDTLQLKDIPTINAIVDYIGKRASGVAVPSGSAPSPKAPVREPEPAAAAAPAADAGREDILDRLLDMFAAKTGYPKDMLEPDLDLEADLGIDTVKQAELFGELRESYGLPRDDTLQLKDIPTINAIVDYILRHANGPSAAAPAQAATQPAPSAHALAPEPTAQAPPADTMRSSTASPGTVDRAAVLDRLLDVFADKTGYPKDMLEPDLDLEADLGIDTVKQAELFGELRETYGLPRDDTLQLSDIPTINAIVGYIVARRGGSVPAQPAQEAAPEPAGPKVAAAPGPATPTSVAPAGDDGIDRAKAVERIRALVAEKTGYPPDLLEEDLDLEADLGIDTVKQAEIFGEVREAFGIPPVENVQLSDYPTLGRVADFVVEQHVDGATVQPTAPGPTTAREPRPVTRAETTAAPGDKGATRRYVVRYVRVQGASVAPADKSLQGRTLIGICPDQTDAFVRAIRDRGGVLLPIEDVPSTFDEAQQTVAALRKDHPRIHGILVAAAPFGGNGATGDLGADDVKGVFHLIKAVLTAPDNGSLTTLAVATRMGGGFGQGGDGPLNVYHGALAGLAKAVARELPGALVKAVDFPADAASETVASVLTEELGRRDGLVEVGTHAGRGTLKLVEDETVEESIGVEWGPEDVLLVPGGAQGITSEILNAVAARDKCRFVLLGRTQLIDGVDRFAAMDEGALADEKKKVTERLKAAGDRVTPVTVEKEFSKITKSVEIHRTIQAIQAAGGDALYVQGDVTMTEDVANAVELGSKLFGPITGIIHAAGVEESKLIVDKTAESFDRVFDVKVAGAFSLLAATKDQPVKSFIAFASIAGRFGNAGQADYSAANDALAKLSILLRRQRGPDFPAVTIDWSAWDQKGMATRGSIMTVLKSLGVAPIPLEAGIARFLDETAHGMQDPEVVVASELGDMASPGLFASNDEVEAPTSASRRDGSGSRAQATLPTAAGSGGQQVVVVAPKPTGDRKAPLLTTIEEQSTDRLVATVHLDADRDPYLDDHAIDATPVFPGVFGIEAFAQAMAPLAPGFTFAGARHVEYRLPLKLPRRRPVDARIIVQVSDRGDDVVEAGCRLESTFVNSKGQTLGAPRIHFTATLIFEHAPPSGGKAVNVPETPETLEPEAIYERFFHGPSFQVLGTLGFPSDDADTAVGVYAWPTKATMAEGDDGFLTVPRVRELAFQAAGGHELFRHDHLALPRRVGRLRHYGVPRDGEKVVAVAHFKRVADAIATYDVTVQTEDGRVLEVLDDYQMIRTDAAVQAAQGPEPAATTSYRARWGHDLPVPMPQARAVLVNADEITERDVKPETALTEGERKDQERYRNDKRAREFFMGRLAAKEAVALLLERPVTEARGVEIRRLESGRPEVQSAQAKDVLVTISHQGPYAVGLAVRQDASVKAVGIDFDLIEDKPKGFETESFTEDERWLIDTLSRQGRPRAELQVVFWTVKEAVLKALGKGFALDLHSVQVRRIDGDAVDVELRGDAKEVLGSLNAGQVGVEAWTRDNYAYALAWLT